MQSYPLPDSGIQGVIYSISFGLFIAGFLWFFKPFDLNILAYTHTEVLFFGIITSAVFLLFQVVLPNLLPTIFSENKWRVWHQLCFYAMALFIIATLNGLYINYLNELDFSWQNYIWIIIRTMVLGIFPIGFYVLFSHNQKLKRNTTTAQQLETWIEEDKGSVTDRAHHIHTQLKEEAFVLQENTFLYANASGNYLYVYTTEGKRSIHRITLQSFQQQLSSAYLIRCHRSYLVNLQQVDSISGNAQGLSLHLRYLNVAIPVSRKYISTIRAHYQRLQA
ncbi:MAG: LytTR family DNA-binding domain-containing protein [Bacteroidota bacterium]